LEISEPGIYFLDTIIKDLLSDSYADLAILKRFPRSGAKFHFAPMIHVGFLRLTCFPIVENSFTEKSQVFILSCFKKHIPAASELWMIIIDLRKLEKVDGVSSS